ncbi:cagY like domain protein [Helicobacter pylori]
MFDSHDKSFQGSLPHIVTMGRDKILQQTPLKPHQTQTQGVFKTFKE